MGCAVSFSILKGVMQGHAVTFEHPIDIFASVQAEEGPDFFTTPAPLGIHLCRELFEHIPSHRCPFRQSFASALPWDRRAPARLQKPRWSVALPGKTLG